MSQSKFSATSQNQVSFNGVDSKASIPMHSCRHLSSLTATSGTTRIWNILPWLLETTFHHAPTPSANTFCAAAHPNGLALWFPSNGNRRVGRPLWGALGAPGSSRSVIPAHFWPSKVSVWRLRPPHLPFWEAESGLLLEQDAKESTESMKLELLETVTLDSTRPFLWSKDIERRKPVPKSLNICQFFLALGKLQTNHHHSRTFVKLHQQIHPKPPGISGAHEDFVVREYGKTHCVHQIFHAKRADLLVDHRVGGAVEIGRQSAIWSWRNTEKL